MKIVRLGHFRALISLLTLGAVFSILLLLSLSSSSLLLLNAAASLPLLLSIPTGEETSSRGRDLATGIARSPAMLIWFPASATQLENESPSFTRFVAALLRLARRAEAGCKGASVEGDGLRVESLGGGEGGELGDREGDGRPELSVT